MTTTITENQIKGMAEQNQVIPLIKEYRSLANSGLKEAKDLIESCLVFDPSSPDKRKYDMDKLLRIFAPYLPKNSPINMVIASEKNKDIHANLKKAINMVLSNYKLLGYKDPFALLENVVANYKNNT